MRILNLTGALCLFLSFFSNPARSQNSNVSIGTETIKSGAVLWLKATGNQGLILPVVNNRSNFTGLNGTDDKGMVIFDSSDNKIYYWDGSAWVGVGSGSAGVNQVLSLSGNAISLTGSPGSNVSISSTTPTIGQALVWNGTAWASISLTGDVTGSVGSNSVNGLKGKSIPSLPSSSNALVYDGTNWVFQPISSSGEANTASNVGTGGTGIFKQKTGINLEFNKLNAGSNRITVTSDLANSEIDIDVAQANLTLAATQITGLGTLATLSVINSTQITDGSITSADLQDGAVTGNKIAIAGASTGQVLKFNGSTWTPQTDDVGAGATPTLANGQLLTGNGTANSATSVTGDIALSGGALTIKTNAVTTGMIQGLAVDGTKLADNSVNSAKISDGTITSADILDAQISSLDIANGAVATVDVLDGAITTPKILDGAVTGAKISTAGAGAGQVLKYNGTTWLPQNDDTGSTITLANGQLLTGNGTINSATTVTGDIALSGGAMTIKTNVVTTGMIQALAVDGTKLADNSVNSAKISDNTIASADILDATVSSLDIANGAVATVDILDGAVTGAKISTTGASSGQVLKYDGTTWLPQNDDTGAIFNTANQVPRGNGTTQVSSNIYSDGTNVGIGTPAPTAKLDITGTIKILDGTQGINKVLTSDANGLASWQNLAASSAGILAGTGNTGIGTSVQQSLSSGSYNSGFGIAALAANTTASWNSGFGANALLDNTGPGNSAVGYFSLGQNIGGQYNSALGWHALYSNTAGDNNVGIGLNAGEGGFPNATGNNNVFIGNSTGFGVAGPFSNAIAIGYGARVSQNNTMVFGGTLATGNSVRVGIGTETPRSVLELQNGNLILSGSSTNATTQLDPVDIDFKTHPLSGDLFKAKIWTDPASNTLWISTASTLPQNRKDFYIDPNGAVGIARDPTVNIFEVEGDASKTFAGTWVANSDRRIKTDIRDIDNSIDLIKRLRPVKFKYTDEWKMQHPTIKDQYYYNFIAQEYQQVFPESVKSSGEYLNGQSEAVLQIDTYNSQIAAIKALQELIQRVEQLEKENAKLKSEKGTLESRLDSYDDNQKALQKDIEMLKEMIGLISSKK
jgi:uncharacterized protein (UPF0335 family)